MLYLKSKTQSHIKLKILFVALMFSSFNIKSQIFELGFYGGFSSFFGDASLYESRSFLSSFSPTFLSGGITYKYWLTDRSIIRLDGGVNMLRLGALSSSREHEMPEFNTIVDFAGIWEYSFYNIHPYRYDPVTPYIFAGLAFVNYDDIAQTNKRLSNNKIVYEKNRDITIGIPLGLGMKIKFMRDITFSVEYKLTYAFTDNIDWSHPDDRVYYHAEKLDYGSTDTNDFYGLLGVSMTYMFGVEECNCEPRYQKLNR